MSNWEKATLSIIIVNFNAGHFLTDCLRALDQIRDEATIEIWVVDNKSSDDSLLLAQKQFPNIHYLKNDRNLGFAKANNLAAKKVKSEFVLFLNPDVKVLPKAIAECISFLGENGDVGALTCRVELEDGSTDLASHRGFPTPVASFFYFLGDDRLYHLTDQDMTKPHQVDAISGAFFMTRKKVLEEVNFFDEDYFLYGEDLDLCFKIKQVGYKIYFLPSQKVIHYKGISSGIKDHSQRVTTASGVSRQKALDAFYQTMKIFYQKNLSQKYPFFVNWLVILAINLKWQISKIAQKV